MLLRVLLFALALAVTGCSVHVPGIHRPAGRIVRVQPYMMPARSVQGLVERKTADDILDVVLLPMRDPGDGVFRPISRQTGELLEPVQDPVEALNHNCLFVDGWGHRTVFEAPIQVAGLKANGRYRLTALAFDKNHELISDVEASSVELTLTGDEVANVVTPLPLQLVDTHFAAKATVQIALAGKVSRLDRLDAVLFRIPEDPGDGGDLVPNETYSLPATMLPFPLEISGLRANSRYVLVLMPTVSEGEAPEPIQLWLDVGKDDALPKQEVTVLLP